MTLLTSVRRFLPVIALASAAPALLFRKEKREGEAPSAALKITTQPVLKNTREASWVASEILRHAASENFEHDRDTAIKMLQSATMSEYDQMFVGGFAAEKSMCLENRRRIAEVFARVMMTDKQKFFDPSQNESEVQISSADVNRYLNLAAAELGLYASYVRDDTGMSYQVRRVPSGSGTTYVLAEYRLMAMLQPSAHNKPPVEVGLFTNPPPHENLQ